MRRSLLIAAALAALCVPAASAKEGAWAHLLAPLPAEGQAGSLVTVRWTVTVPAEHGKRVPFGADGMFVVLKGVGGARTRATAASGAPPYRVRLRVPAGGIRAVRFGLMGTASGPDGDHPAPIYFALH